MAAKGMATTATVAAAMGETPAAAVDEGEKSVAAMTTVAVAAAMAATGAAAMAIIRHSVAAARATRATKVALADKSAVVARSVAD